MRIRFAILTVAVALVAARSGGLLAQAPPTRVFGSVTIGGAPAPAGTEIKAFINDQQCGSFITTDDGLFRIDVDASATTANCGEEELTVTFTINGVPTNETTTFGQGTFVALNLSPQGDPPAPPVAQPPTGNLPLMPSGDTPPAPTDDPPAASPDNAPPATPDMPDMPDMPTEG